MGGPSRITVIGVGLIGGSIAMAVKTRWPATVITGFDIDLEVLGTAHLQGVVDIASPTLGEACSGADFIFIATPVSVIPDVLKSLAGRVESQTIITDVGSTKKRIVDAAFTFLSSGTTFIGGHPMAGSEQEGLGAATASLLKEAIYVLTPTSSTSPEAFQKLHSFLTKLGARVMALSPEKHDEVVAAVSHLPHVLAAVLVNLVATVEEGVENRLLFAAGGFRDMTRIAAGNPQLWLEICMDNRQAIVETIDKFIAATNEVRQMLAGADRESLAAALISAKDRRASMSLGQPVAAGYRQFDVPVSDRPGAISRITWTFGQLGINIADVQIVHLSEESGVIKLLVNDDPQVEKALAELKGHGFDIVERIAQ